MECPCCKGLLIEQAIGDINFYSCTNCYGVWIPKGKLDLLLNFFVKRVEQAKDRSDTEKTKIKVVDLHKEAKLKCPVCDIQMFKFNYAYDSNVIIDRCLTCSGIYTDKGEVNKIAEYLKKGENQEQIAKIVFKDMSNKEIAKKEFEDLQGALVSMALGFALPLADENPTVKKPVFTISIIAVNALVLLLGFLFVKDYKTYYYTFGLVPLVLMQGKRLFSLLAHLFIHGGLLHLAGNMLFLWIFGDNVEDKLGHIKFILLFLFYGIIASLGHVVLNSSSSIPLVGSSGAIAGIMGSYFFFWPRAKLKILVYGKRRTRIIPAFYFFIFWIILQIFLSIRSPLFGTVSWQAHIIGFLVGVFTAWILQSKI